MQQIFEIPQQTQKKQKESRFEKKFELRKEYENNIKLLLDFGFIELNPENDRLGYYDLMDNFHELPSYELFREMVIKESKKAKKEISSLKTLKIRDIYLVPLLLSTNQFKIVEQEYEAVSLVPYVNDTNKDYSILEKGFKSRYAENLNQVSDHDAWVVGLEYAGGSFLFGRLNLKLDEFYKLYGIDLKNMQETHMGDFYLHEQLTRKYEIFSGAKTLYYQ